MIKKRLVKKYQGLFNEEDLHIIDSLLYGGHVQSKTSIS